MSKWNLRQHIAKLLAVSLVAGAAWLAIALVGPPDVVPDDAPADRFSAERAMAHVRAIAAEPHPIGSQNHEVVHRYIVNALGELGLEPVTQGALGRNVYRGRPILGHVRNIVARIPGRASTGAILLVTHWDSQRNTPGAGDATAGVAALLETARALRQGTALDNDVIVLFTDGEESGLIGAQAFMAHHEWARDARLVINLEARGNSGPSLLFETSAGNAWLIEQLDAAVEHPRSGSLFYEVYRRLPNDTDFTVFKRYGLPGYGTAFIGDVIHYHAPTDTVDRLDVGSVQHHGEYALPLARHLGQVDLTDMPAPGQGGNAVYFNTLGSHFVTYPATWSVWLIAVVIAAWAFSWYWSAGRSLRWLRVALGFLAFPLVALCTGVTAWLILELLRGFHPEWRLFSTGGIYHSGPVFAAIAAGAATVFIGLYAMMGRVAIMGGRETSLGVQLWLVIGLGALHWLVPTASYVVLVPLAGVVLGQLVERALVAGDATDAGSASRRAWMTPLVRALAALPAVLLFAPAIHLLFEVMSINTVIPQGASIAVLGALLVPWLGSLAPYRRALVGAAAVATMASGLMAGPLAPDHDERHPLQSPLAYYADADSQKAAWIADRLVLDSWSQGLMGRDGSTLEIPTVLQVARSGPAPYRAPSAARVERARPASQPESESESESAPESGYRLELLLSTPDALAAEVLIPASVGLRRLTVHSEAIDEPGFYRADGRDRSLRIAGTNRVPTRLELVLEHPQTVTLTVIARGADIPFTAEERAAIPSHIVPSPAHFLYWPFSTYVARRFHFEP